MGKLFRSWFKKKKKQESTTCSTEKHQHYEKEQQLTGTKIHPDDEALTFTHGSLLDDVLSGLKDQHDGDAKSKRDTPDSPLSSSICTIIPNQRSQQKQINNRLSENNGSSIYQQTVVTQTPPCRPTPDYPSISPSSPSLMAVPPGSATTPSAIPNTKLVPSSLTSHSFSSSSALLAQSISQPNNTFDQQNATVHTELGISNGHGTIIKNNHQHQKPIITAQHDQQQLDEHQDQHEQNPVQHSVVKTPSIVSSKISHDSNQDKRNRYLQVTGVSMSRMKERHRQECRRSMQPNSSQLNVSTQQQPDQLQSTQSTISSSPHPSFQSSPLNQHQQQNQQKKLNHLAQRHYLTSPSMPSLHPSESMPFYTPHPSSQQPLGSTIPAATAATSFPPLLPVGTVPQNSIVRSSSLMTDIYQSSSSNPDSGITTSAPLPNDRINQPHQWRQQPLFPYQSDILLPQYNPSQLNTIPPQQQMGSMVMPSPSSYRINTTNANHKQMFPRSASVYGSINQYNQQKQHDIMDRVSHGGGFLPRTSMMDSSSQPSINYKQHRKSMSSAPRSYKPQLSLSNLSPNDHQQQSGKKSKLQGDDTISDKAELPSNDDLVATDLPTSFLPSTHSPCDEPKNDTTEAMEKTTSSSSDNVQQQLTTIVPPPTDSNIHQEHEDDSSSSNNNNNSDDVNEVNVSRSNSSCTINQSNNSTDSSIKNDDSNGGLDEKLEIPSLVEHLPTKLQQQAELRIMKKHRQPHRRRRRFSLPIMPTSPSTSSSTSSVSSISSSKEQKDASGLVDAKKSITQIPQFTSSKKNKKTTDKSSQKIETPPPSNDCTHHQADMDHSTSGSYHQGQQQQHHHHPGLPVPVCSISGSASSSHRGSWAANSYHSCVAPLAINAAPSCCPPSSAQQHNCQQQQHYHHQQAPHFHGHHHPCGHHTSSIPLATSTISPPCCSTPPVVQSPPPPPPAPCCSQSYHYRHHHHHGHHQRCQHKHTHHHNHSKQQMKKSNSVMSSSKVDQDDAATIRSNATKSVLGEKGHQQQQKKLNTPPSTDDDDDDHTISETSEKKPMTSQSVQRPLFRSFLPRPPRFSTSIPRPPQQQQQQQQQQKKQYKKQQPQKVKVSASKSSYSWIPSRA